MTREEAVARIKDHIEIHRCHERNAVKIFEALDMAIKALEQPEPCEDAVSRADCLQALSNMMDIDGFRDGWAVSRANVECMLKSMPSVTPKEQKWIPCYPSELPKNMPLWATFDNGDGYRYVETVFWDMTEWNTDVSNVIAYMPYEEPEPYREGGGE